MEEERKIKVSKGDTSDNEDYVDFINYVFGFNGYDSSFYKLLPKLFGRGNDPAKDTYFVKDGTGRILACVGAFLLEMSVCDKKIKACGIGNVAVHPRHRGKGYMKAAMHSACDGAIKQGCSMLVLSGKRTRYDHFGFEKCGTEACYTVTEKTLKDRDPDARPTLLMKRLEREDAIGLDNIYSLHNSSARPFRYERPREKLYDILTSWQSVPYVFYDKEAFAGWAVVKRNDVNEAVFSDVKYLKDMIYLLAKDKSHLCFHIPECDVTCADVLYHYAETVYVGADLCFNILSYEKTLLPLMELKNGYEKLIDASAVFDIDGFAGREKLMIRVSGGKISVAFTDLPADIELSHLEAMQLFFTHKAPARARLKNREALTWFPLPLYIYSPDNV